MTYHTLPAAYWNRREGLHELDFGLDLILDGEVWGVTWSVKHGTLAIAVGSVEREVIDATSFDASGEPPWRDLLGDELLVHEQGPSVIGLSTATSHAIWLVAGNYLDEADLIIATGDSVLVVFDSALMERLALSGASGSE